MVKTVVICDRCHAEVSPAGDTASSVRFARDRGWYVMGWVAYCPECTRVAGLKAPRHAAVAPVEFREGVTTV